MAPDLLHEIQVVDWIAAIIKIHLIEIGSILVCSIGIVRPYLHSMAYLHKIFFIAVAWLTLQSCNLVALVDRKQHKRLENSGLIGHTYHADHANMFCRTSTQGKPKLMLIHGYGASGTSQYYRAAKLLMKDYDVLLPDLMFHGRSGSQSSDFSVQAQADHLNLLLDSLQITEPIAVVGNSYGGVVAAYFAELYPSRVSNLILYDAPVKHYSLQYADSLAKAMRVGSIHHLLAPTTVFENRQSLSLIFHKPPYIPRFVRRQMVKHGTLPVRDVQLKLIDHLIEHEQDLNAHNYQWRCPVYLIWGREDRLIPLATANALAEEYQIESQRFVVFDQAAHAINIERPVEFVHAINKLLKE